jgi:signal transduction histidine kinase
VDFRTSGSGASRLGQVALSLLACAAVFGIIWAHRFTRPLERLSAAAGEIAKGRFQTAVTVAPGDEIGDLATAFNQMAGGLRDRDEALQVAQSQLVQSEKMSAFGQLGAGIAHEVKNPLAGILGCAQLALRGAEPGSSVHTNLGLIEKETRRCKSIIDNLLKFARQEKAHMDPIEVNPVVSDAVAIVRHQLEMNRVHIETDLGSALPEIYGNANQLQQVVMNLMINAQQAMEGEPGNVRVATVTTPEGGVEIRVGDNGPGIRKENLAKIFEPFFTTKPAGQGTGLGLSVSFGIVKDHGGEIRVESEVGQGSTFIITLPERSKGPFSTAPGREAEAPSPA